MKTYTLLTTLFPPFPLFFTLHPRPSGITPHLYHLARYPSTLPALLILVVLYVLCSYTLMAKHCYKEINPIAMLIGIV